MGIRPLSFELNGALLEAPISITVDRRPSCRAWQDFRDAEPYFRDMPMNSNAGSQYDPRHAVSSCTASPEWWGRVEVHGLVEGVRLGHGLGSFADSISASASRRRIRQHSQAFQEPSRLFNLGAFSSRSRLASAIALRASSALPR